MELLMQRSFAAQAIKHLQNFPEATDLAHDPTGPELPEESHPQERDIFK
jgi:hypothetical protein